MRPHTILLAGALALAGAAPASAQAIPRADVTGILGWFNANKSEFSSYNDWYNRSLYGGAVLGWLWTDHLKSEVEIGATSAAELYVSQPVNIDGQQTYASSQNRFSTRRITAGQQYQFLHNARAHPHAGVGLDLTWETHQRRDDQVVLYDQASRVSRVLRPAQTFGPSTDFYVRPFAEVGAKLYLSERGFFRTDLRLTFRHGIDEALLRFGFGVDF